VAESPVIDPRNFRNALGAFTTGVTIVTTRDEAGHDIGLTANSFNSVSLDPPLVLWSLAKSSLSLKAFTESKYFAVHILAADQQPLSDRFAKRGVDKFAELNPGRGHGGVPLLEGCAARFECETAFRYDGGDHEIFVGRVITFEHFPRPPLVFMGGRYAVALQKPVVKVAESDDDVGGLPHDALHYLIANAHFLLDHNYWSAMQKHGISKVQLYALSLLGEASLQSGEQLDATLRFTGQRFTQEESRDLLARGHIRADADGRFELTAAGQKLLIESAVVAKAIEEDAQTELDFSETQILRQLLKRLVRRLLAARQPG
jgi:3-hydroxy-9,10-secoandrosta-1,3,5(10)-triene-9,17-dione monooxygenase reductase component